MEESKPLTCSFCGKSQKQAQKLIMAGSTDIGICEECVALCTAIIQEESHRGPGLPGP